MANAYATIANGGRAAEPYIIEKVVDRNGETRYQHRVSDTEAVEQDIDRDVSYALQQVVQNGSGTAALQLGRPAAGKTGTATNGEGAVSSAWFTGYTPQLSTSVMYVRGKGNEQLDGWLPSYFGADYPADTWTAVMTRAMEGLPVENFPLPAYVDGTAPEEGHAPYTPPPSPTRQPSPTKQPSQSQSQSPSQEPSPTETTPTQEPSPTNSCGVLGCDPSDSSSPSPSQSPSQSPSGPGNGGGPGGPGGPGNRNGAATERRYSAG
jgi:membrane peptidoglycan carboxypeptidase